MSLSTLVAPGSDMVLEFMGSGTLLSPGLC